MWQSGTMVDRGNCRTVRQIEKMFIWSGGVGIGGFRPVQAAPVIIERGASWLPAIIVEGVRIGKQRNRTQEWHWTASS